MSEPLISDLSEYIRWVGAFDFERLPLQEADAVILCVLSYFDYSEMCKESSEFRLESCLPLIEQNAITLCTAGADAGNSEILKEAALSVRFGNLVISDYTEQYRPEPALQFSAVCFTDRDRFTFLAFRGTDSTIAGWKEDFMISFEKTEAQDLAYQYAAQILKKSPERTIYLGGHSKGGNEALYAACMLPAELFSRISRIYLLDSPGFCSEVMDLSLVGRVDPIATRIIPEHDLIGKIYEPQISDVRIVKSSGTGFMQHNAATWLVDHGSLAETEKNTAGSIWLSGLLNRWVSSIPAEKRPEFIGELFQTLESQGKESLRSLTSDDFLSALKALAKTRPETKQILMDLPKQAVFEDRMPQKKEGGFIQKIRENCLLQGLLLIALGLIFVFVSGEFLYFSSTALAISIVVIQLFFTIRKLVKNGWKMEGLRNRIIVLLVFTALFAVLLIKEEALFILGSMIFGILFLAVAFISVNAAKKASRKSFPKVLHILEASFSFAFSASFFIIPEAQLIMFETAVGVCIAADGLARIIYHFAVRKKGRKM